MREDYRSGGLMRNSKKAAWLGLLSLMFMAFAPMSALAADPCQNIKLQKAADAPPFARVCTSATTLTGFESGDALANYYGYVAATIQNTAITVDQKRSLGDFLAGIFKSNDFSAQISVVIEIDTAFGRTPIAERPLLVVTRKTKDGLDAQVETSMVQDAQITPYFAIDSNNSGVNLRIKVARINDTSSNAVNILKGATDAAASLGGHGWLVNGLSEPTLFKVLTKSQDQITNYFSDETTVSVNSRLDFRVGGATAVTLESGWATGSVTSVFKVEFKLKVQQSLITDLLFKPETGPRRPNVTDPNLSPPAGSWATRIVVTPATDTSTAKTLAEVLRSNGVPRSLSDLSNDPSKPAVSAAAQVQQACADMSKALADGQYFRLNQTDTELVMYDELLNNGVFRKFATKDLQCVANLTSAWKAKYGLVPPSNAVVVVVAFGQIDSRFRALSGRWRAATPELRRVSLGDSFTGPVSVQVPVSLFPGLAAVLVSDDAGMGTGQINPKALAEVQLSCFGNYQKDSDATDVGTGYAKFGGPETYLIRARFVASEDSGLLVTDLRIRALTDAEMRAGVAAQANCAV